MKFDSVNMVLLVFFCVGLFFLIVQFFTTGDIRLTLSALAFSYLFISISLFVIRGCSR